jgi:hypothetical protein
MIFMAVLFFGVIIVCLVFYLVSIIDLHRTEFKWQKDKARLLTLIWFFPLFGALYYWWVKKQFTKKYSQ